MNNKTIANDKMEQCEGMCLCVWGGRLFGLEQNISKCYLFAIG